MKASDFLRTYAAARRHEWEAAAVALAQSGELAPAAWVEVPVRGGGHTGVVKVSHDVLAVGSGADYLRMPLTATAAQAALNASGALLPTKKLAADINHAASLRLVPVTYWPNPGADLASFARHSKAIDEQVNALRGSVFSTVSGLVTGGKKDLVVSNRTGVGKEMIYGWYSPRDLPGVPLYSDVYGAKYIQPLSDVHDHGYVDYSHGIRLVHPEMVADGDVVKTEDVYRSPILSPLVSDEGPIRNPRYQTTGYVAPPASSLFSNLRGHARVYVEGLRAEALMSRTRRSM
jgi:hypothetical protein